MKPLFSSQIDRYFYLKQCDSTNEYAMLSLSNNDPKSNICVYTFNQSAGRGQIGRKWYGGSGKNLTTSFRIPLDGFLVSKQFTLNIAFSLAVLTFIRLYIKSDVTIKWPNDIYVGDKKIAGLLIQNNLRADKINSTILGVGINVNELVFPDDLPNPVSLAQLLDTEFDLVKLQHQLSELVLDYIQNLIAQEDKCRKDYITNLYRLNEEADFLMDGQKVKGIIRGISEQGKLELECYGQRRLFNFRELVYVV